MKVTSADDVTLKRNWVKTDKVSLVWADITSTPSLKASWVISNIAAAGRCLALKAVSAVHGLLDKDLLVTCRRKH